MQSEKNLRDVNVIYSINNLGLNCGCSYIVALQSVMKIFWKIADKCNLIVVAIVQNPLHWPISWLRKVFENLDITIHEHSLDNPSGGS